MHGSATSDLWNAYEVSWLRLGGRPDIGILSVAVPADSPNLIESKSFKLYLNSFNQAHLTKDELEQKSTPSPSITMLIFTYQISKIVSSHKLKPTLQQGGNHQNKSSLFRFSHLFVSTILSKPVHQGSFSSR